MVSQLRTSAEASVQSSKGLPRLEAPVDENRWIEVTPPKITRGSIWTPELLGNVEPMCVPRVPSPRLAKPHSVLVFHDIWLGISEQNDDE